MERVESGAGKKVESELKDGRRLVEMKKEESSRDDDLSCCRVGACCNLQARVEEVDYRLVPVPLPSLRPSCRSQLPFVLPLVVEIRSAPPRVVPSSVLSLSYYPPPRFGSIPHSLAFSPPRVPLYAYSPPSHLEPHLLLDRAPAFPHLVLLLMRQYLVLRMLGGR